jgi:microcystin degradation protein MlrC
LTDGHCVGRRGIYAGLRLELGPCAALQVGGVTVVVISHRVQCADPIFFEMVGLDIRRARSVVVKSRRFEWTRLPRPVIPLDDNVEWRPPNSS